MSLFSRKKKVRLETFCENFYENFILNPVVGTKGLNVLSTFAGSQKNLIAEVDSRFAAVDVKKLVIETIVLRLEMFALAWQHQFGADLSVQLSFFTYNYLHAQNRSDLWDGMEIYNQQVSRFCLCLRKAMGSGWERYITNCNSTRFHEFKKHLDIARKSAMDLDDDESGECIARALNRLFTEKAWQNHAGVALLVQPLCKGLGFEREFLPNSEASFRLAAMITGLYNGARQVMSDIRPV